MLDLTLETLKQRLTELETKVEQLQQKQAPVLPQDDRPWWEQIRGRFRDDPDYDEAMRLGREHWESLRPNEGENNVQRLF